MFNNTSSAQSSQSYTNTQFQNNNTNEASSSKQRSTTNRQQASLLPQQNNLASSENNFPRGHSTPTALLSVEQILGKVRSEYYKNGFKSDNKLDTCKPEELENTRQQQAHHALKEARECTDLLQSVLTAKAHDCHELACLACYELANIGHSSAYLSIGSHMVAVIGLKAESDLNSDLTEWPENIFICDPWSNIACKAKSYPDLFRKKMNKWGREGKLINLNNKWMPAHHPTHIQSVFNEEIQDYDLDFGQAPFTR